MEQQDRFRGCLLGLAAGGAALMAANMGDDADTTAAVCGQVAGAFYGESGIPADWLAKLAMYSEICDLADRLMAPKRGLPSAPPSRR